MTSPVFHKIAHYISLLRRFIAATAAGKNTRVSKLIWSLQLALNFLLYLPGIYADIAGDKMHLQKAI